MHTIEKAIPIPQDQSNGGRRRYPLNAMEVGDSFWSDQGQNAVNAAVAYKRRNPGWNYRSMTTKAAPDGSHCETGVRIWRIA